MEETSSLVKQTQIIMEGLGKLESASLDESLNLIKGQAAQLVEDGKALRRSLSQIATSLDNKQKELLSSHEIMSLKLDNLKTSGEKVSAELARQAQDAHTTTIKEIGSSQKAIIGSLEKQAKSLSTEIAELLAGQKEFRQSTERQHKIVTYSLWGGMLLVMILQAFCLYFAYYK